VDPQHRLATAKKAFWFWAGKKGVPDSDPDWLNRQKKVDWVTGSPRKRVDFFALWGLTVPEKIEIFRLAAPGPTTQLSVLDSPVHFEISLRQSNPRKLGGVIGRAGPVWIGLKLWVFFPVGASSGCEAVG